MLPDPTYQSEYSALFQTFLKIQNLREEIDNYKSKGQDNIGYDKALNTSSLFMGLAEEEFYDCLLWVKARIDETEDAESQLTTNTRQV
jgi:hypothetical protein